MTVVTLIDVGVSDLLKRLDLNSMAFRFSYILEKWQEEFASLPHPLWVIGSSDVMHASSWPATNYIYIY